MGAKVFTTTDEPVLGNTASSQIPTQADIIDGSGSHGVQLNFGANNFLPSPNAIRSDYLQYLQTWHVSLKYAPRSPWRCAPTYLVSECSICINCGRCENTAFSVHVSVTHNPICDEGSAL